MAKKAPRRATHEARWPHASRRDLWMCGAYVVLAGGLSLLLLSDLVFGWGLLLGTSLLPRRSEAARRSAA